MTKKVEKTMEQKNVFLIGSNGIPANYGGFETFVENLVVKKKDPNIKYHVACLAKDNKEFEYHGARCFNVKVPEIGSAKAEYYDLVALEKTIHYIKKNKLQNVTVYVLGTGVGLFIWFYKMRLKRRGIKLYVNPDGCEWKRAKWNAILKKFFRVCEKKMAKHADLLICDSKSVEQYIQEDYQKYKPNTTFIAYGSDIQTNFENWDETKLETWYQEKRNYQTQLLSNCRQICTRK